MNAGNVQEAFMVYIDQSQWFRTLVLEPFNAVETAAEGIFMIGFKTQV